jgi:hypothetical protein
MGLEVSKAHLDLLALVAGFGELGRPHQRAGKIAGFLTWPSWFVREVPIASFDIWFGMKEPRHIGGIKM